MRGPERCPHCDQLLPHNIRLGVALTPLQTRIFDTIKSAGAEGITVEALRERLFADRNIKSNQVIYTHLNTIRFLLADSGWQISYAGRAANYRLVRSTIAYPYRHDPLKVARR